AVSPSFLFSFYRCGAHPDLDSFPTRRSSDLASSAKRPGRGVTVPMARTTRANGCSLATAVCAVTLAWAADSASSAARARQAAAKIGRAHSELQSLRHLVCRLLLEKKKTQKQQ